MSYRSRLAALDESLTLVKPAPSRLILLTGQSSFRSSRLTPEQVEFLQAVAPPGVEPLLNGFPYHADFDRAAPTPGLPAASIRNALQVCWCLFSPAYRRSVARVLQTVIRNTGESLYIVTGSCGLQMLASAWPMLTVPQSLRLRVVALGPALLRAGALPVERIAAVQGRRDPWSRLLYRGRVAGHCHSGHMDYWSDPDARELVTRLLRDGDEASLPDEANQPATVGRQQSGTAGH
jgi:hypothetical protein